MLVRVGLVDWSELTEARSCAVCGAGLANGRAPKVRAPFSCGGKVTSTPLDQRVDAEVPLSPGVRPTATLPSEFVIHAHCRSGQRAWVACACSDEVCVDAGPVTRYRPPSNFDTRALRRGRRLGDLARQR